MLKLIRKRLKVFLWILVLAFVLWGAGTVFTARRFQGPDYAGSLYGKKVSWDVYQAALEGTVHQLKLTYGASPELLRRLMELVNIYDLAWERLILFREAKQRGIRVTDQELAHFIQQHPLFKDANGLFDKSLYRRALEYGFETSPHRFEEELRATLTVSKLTDSVGREVRVTEDEVRAAYHQSLGDQPFNEEQFTKDRSTWEERVRLQKREAHYQTWLTQLRAQARLDSRVEEIYQPRTPEPAQATPTPEPTPQ